MEPGTLQTTGKTSVHWSVWVGRVLSGIAVLGSIASGIAKLVAAAPVVEMLVGKLGYTLVALNTIGILEIACGLLYAAPKTRVLGAMLLTAFLGGATASHWRVGDPFIAPIVVAVIVWLGLYLRDPRIRALVPLTSSSNV